MMSEMFRRRRLPHWDRPNSIYFVTACLADSLPARGLLDLERRRQKILQRFGHEVVASQAKLAAQKQLFARSDWWLDRFPARRWLQDDRLAAEVENALLHFAGIRYALWSYVIMPSHFHWVFEPNVDWFQRWPSENRSPRERIMHSVKRHSARRCNQLLNRLGKFWQDESYDRVVRDLRELEQTIQYVEQNPVAAGLANAPDSWCYSSASFRIGRFLPVGKPIVGRSQI